MLTAGYSKLKIISRFSAISMYAVSAMIHSTYMYVFTVTGFSNSLA